nr:hypothetical protein Iba_chr10fCG9730 [Ipomoea batatas]
MFLSVDVHKEDEAELTSHWSSEVRLEDNECVASTTTQGFADILLVTLFFLTFVVHDSEDFEVVCSINLVSHGLAAIQRSNQPHPELFLSQFWVFAEGTEIVLRVSELLLHISCSKSNPIQRKNITRLRYDDQESAKGGLDPDSSPLLPHSLEIFGRSSDHSGHGSSN